MTSVELLVYLMDEACFPMLLEHDTYHAGEINHIRSILSGENRWAWQILEAIDPIQT